METYQKVIISGDTIHYYKFPKPIEYGQQDTNNNHKKNRRKNPERREDSLYRTKKSVKLLLQSNAAQYLNEQQKPIPAQFYTYTFRENVTNIRTANRLFKNHTKRLNFKLFGKNNAQLKYLVVPEIQKKRQAKFGYAVWHFHVIYFNLPFRLGIKAEIESVWSNGFIFVKAVKDVTHLTRYISKYFTKENHEILLRGEKSYFCSKGLKQPKTIYNPEQIKNLVDLSGQPTFESEYEFQSGKMTYKTFKNCFPGLDTLIADKNYRRVTGLTVDYLTKILFRPYKQWV